MNKRIKKRLKTFIKFDEDMLKYTLSKHDFSESVNAIEDYNWLLSIIKFIDEDLSIRIRLEQTKLNLKDIVNENKLICTECGVSVKDVYNLLGIILPKNKRSGNE